MVTSFENYQGYNSSVPNNHWYPIQNEQCDFTQTNCSMSQDEADEKLLRHTYKILKKNHLLTPLSNIALSRHFIKPLLALVKNIEPSIYSTARAVGTSFSFTKDIANIADLAKNIVTLVNTVDKPKQKQANTNELMSRASSYLSLMKHSSTLLSYTSTATALSLISYPFVGLNLYKSYNEYCSSSDLITLINSYLNGPFDTHSVRELSANFLSLDAKKDDSTWSYNSKKFKFLTSNLSYEAINQLIDLIKKIELGYTLDQNELQQAKNIYSDLASALKFTRNFNTGSSLVGGLSSSYNVGLVMMNPTALVATLGISTLSGAALTGAITYMGIKTISGLDLQNQL